MLTRILTATALLPIVAAIYFGPRWLFLLMAVATGVLAAGESLALFRAKGMRPLAGAAHAGVVILAVAFHSPARLDPASALAVVVALAFGEYLLTRPDVEGALETLSSTLVASLLPALLVGFQVALRGLAENVPAARPGLLGPALLVYLYAVVFGHDAFAYFTGRSIGRLKLSPRVSPKKTVEGLLGGVLGGTLLGVAVAAVLPCGLTLKEAGFFGFLLAAASVAGDLAISLLKRSAGVKDSSHLLPGHGGVLDRLAGVLFAAPLLYILLLALPAVARTEG